MLLQGGAFRVGPGISAVFPQGNSQVCSVVPFFVFLQVNIDKAAMLLPSPLTLTFNMNDYFSLDVWIRLSCWRHINASLLSWSLLRWDVNGVDCDQTERFRLLFMTKRNVSGCYAALVAAWSGPDESHRS